MKFLYEYKTSNNERRQGEISAASRDAVYAALKKEGIRPFKVELAPGFVNHIASLGKRGIAIIVLTAIAAVSTLVALNAKKEVAVVIQETRDAFDSQTRRQILGDVAEVEKGIRTGWKSVFVDEGECFLASFAIPGVPAGVKTTNVEALEEALKREIAADKDDTLVARQIKAMVEGMKDELRNFIAAGGTIQQYGKRLVERQEQEISYYNRVKSELEATLKSGKSREEAEELLERRNADLRNMGIKTIPMPE